MAKAPRRGAVWIGGMLLVWVLAAARSVRAGEGPLTLPEAYRRALERNDQIRLARESRRQAGLFPLRAWTLLTPKFSLSGSRIWQKEISVPVGGAGAPGLPTGALSSFTPSQQLELQSILRGFSSGQPLLVQPTAQDQITLQGSWTLFSGEFLPRLEQAWSTDRAGGDEERRALAETLYQVASQFYQVLQAQQMEDIARESIRMARDHVRDAEARVRVGNAVRTASLQAQLDLKRAERQEVEARGALELAQVSLGISLGLDRLRPLQEPPDPRPPTGSVEDLVGLALAGRPDVRRAEEDVRYAREELAAARGRFLPNLAAQGDFTHTEPPAGLSEPDNWRAMLVLSLPIFQGGGEYLDLLEASSKLRSALDRKTLLGQQVQEEIRRGMVDLEASTENLAAARASILLARENYDLARRSFEVGAATSNEVTDARYALSAAESDLVRETYRRDLGILELQKATGTFLDRQDLEGSVADDGGSP